MSKSRLAQLRNAQKERLFVRFSRRFNDHSFRGYIIDIGPKFFLVARVNDDIWFDGFECFRINDVGGIQQDPNSKFAEAALKKRGERFPKKPHVDVATIEELLISASRVFPLVTIHSERVDPDVCRIGKVVEIGHGRVSLHEINPDASWDAKPTDYQLSKITRVSFGGDYEDALHLVGGGEPELE